MRYLLGGVVLVIVLASGLYCWSVFRRAPIWKQDVSEEQARAIAKAVVLLGVERKLNAHSFDFDRVKIRHDGRQYQVTGTVRCYARLYENGGEGMAQASFEGIAIPKTTTSLDPYEWTAAITVGHLEASGPEVPLSVQRQWHPPHRDKSPLDELIAR